MTADADKVKGLKRSNSNRTPTSGKERFHLDVDKLSFSAPATKEGIQVRHGSLLTGAGDLPVGDGRRGVGGGVIVVVLVVEEALAHGVAELERRECAAELGDLVVAEAEAEVGAALELLEVVVGEAPGPVHHPVVRAPRAAAADDVVGGEEDGPRVAPPRPRRLPLRPAPHVLGVRLAGTGRSCGGNGGGVGGDLLPAAAGGGGAAARAAAAGVARAAAEEEEVRRLGGGGGGRRRGRRRGWCGGGGRGGGGRR